MFRFKSLEMPSKNDCLPGRSQRIYSPENHFVTGAPLSECMSEEKPRILLEWVVSGELKKCFGI